MDENIQEDSADKKIEWQALEYIYQEKTPDWFWALGIIAISAAVISIIYKNYIFAILIVIGGLSLAFFGVRKPKILNLVVSKDGVKIDNYLYPYERLKSFWINTEENEHNLLLMSDRNFMPLLVISLSDAPVGEIKEILLTYIPEERHEEPVSQKIMEYLGF